jgi:hypothetical protein
MNSNYIFINNPYTISQDVDIYGSHLYNNIYNYDYIFSINILSFNNIFSNASFKQNDINIDEYDINISLLDSNHFKNWNSFFNNQSIVKIAAGDSNIGFGSFNTNPLKIGDRLLEIIAHKLFGHAQAHAAIKNDNSFYSHDNKLWDHLSNSISQTTFRNDIFNQYVITGRYNTILSGKVETQTSKIYYDVSNPLNIPLIGWYQFNSLDNYLLDSSGNNYNLINNNSEYKIGSPTGGYASFTGITTTLQIPNIINLNTIQQSTGITISYWCKMLLNCPDNQIFFSFGDRLYHKKSTSTTVLNKWIFGIYYNNINNEYTTYCNFDDENWHHIVWSISNTGKCSIWIDNIKYIGIGTNNNIINGNLNILSNSNYTLSGYGGISDFRIYSNIVKNNDVSLLYNCGINVNTNLNSFLGFYNNNNYHSIWYKFDKNNFNKDYSSNLKNFSLFNNPTINTLDYVAGNSSLELNGNQGIIFDSFNITNINTNINITGGNMEIIYIYFWLKITSLNSNGNDTIFDIGAENINRIKLSRYNTTNYCSIYLSNSTGSQTLIYSSTPIFEFDNTWKFITIKISKASKKVTTYTSYSNQSEFDYSGYITLSINNFGYEFLKNINIFPRKIMYTNNYIGTDKNNNNSGIIGLINNFGIYNTNNSVPLNNIYSIPFNYNFPILDIEPIIWYTFNFNTNLDQNYSNKGNVTGFNINPINNVLYYFIPSSPFGTCAFFNKNKIQYYTINSNITTPLVLYGYQINNGITISFWFCGDPINNTYLFSNSMADKSIYMNICNSNNKLQFNIYNINNNNNSKSYTTNNIFFNNKWHHIIWSINNNGSWTIYIDNILYTTNIMCYTNIIPNGQFNIGGNQYDTTNPYNGYIADFRIYSQVLSIDEVNKLYNYQGKSNIITNTKTTYDTKTINTTTIIDNNVNDVSSWVNFNFNNISLDFPLHVSGSLLLDPSLTSNDINLLQNGPNVGGTSLINGNYDIPILVKFHD